MPPPVDVPTIVAARPLSPVSSNFIALGWSLSVSSANSNATSTPRSAASSKAAEEPLVVGEQAEDAGDHRPVLGHDAEGAGERAVLVEHDARPPHGLAEQIGGQIAHAARTGGVRTRARLHDGTEDVVEELRIRGGHHASDMPK